MSKMRVIAAAEANPGGFDQVLGELPFRSRKKEVRSFQKIEQDLDKIKTDAHEEGFLSGTQKGYQDGLKMGRKEGQEQGRLEALELARQQREAFARDLDDIGLSFQNAVQDWFLHMEKEISAVAMDIASKVVAAELKLDPEKALTMTQECLKEISHAASARVIVNLATYQVLQGHETELMGYAPSLKSIELTLDPSMGDGVVIDTDGGRIDGLISSKFESLIETWRLSA